MIQWGLSLMCQTDVYDKGLGFVSTQGRVSSLSDASDYG